MYFIQFSAALILVFLFLRIVSSKPFKLNVTVLANRSDYVTNIVWLRIKTMVFSCFVYFLSKVINQFSRLNVANLKCSVFSFLQCLLGYLLA